ncbi:glycosyl hydrolases family 15-domain-containing protein [Pilaira anomala]|nr:glycosyl hydrolases family 15-domain-containing protein [Pilaira anomala]
MKSTYDRKHSLERLEYYYQVINTTVLSKQNAASGLIPASVAITTHGDYTDAWVRDNVYSIYCVFGLALAYRRIDDTTGRAFELEHAVVKLMRGILFSMMRQAPKVEKFKKTQNILDSLHAKYNTKTGATVVGDKEWGHLQIDATSFFLVALADMTTSGFSIIYTQDEVDFIQNLVFYIERAYRTPDFGIWERGDKSNHGEPELNSSSIGMAYAALKAINGVNLFGARGSPSSTIYVLPDEMTRNKITLQSVLPRESNSKEVDGSVLSVIGFPAFAVENPELIERTREDAKKKLEGRYGWKRFLRDGHQTVVEDHTRLHYNDSELKVFENIESEWPLFFTYMVLEGLFTDNMDQAEEYRKKLDFVTIDSSLWDPENPRPPEDYKKEGNSRRPSAPCRTASLDLSTAPADLHIPLVPELYYVPAESIEAEKKNPHSQKRIPNDNTPLVWALSLYLLGNMIYENLLSPSELDPLGRRYGVKGEKSDHVVQVVLLSENEELQKTLSTYGLETQSIDQISSSFTVLPPQALVDVYSALGQNNKLELSGRPNHPVGTLATSRLYRIEGHVYAFTPQFMDVDSFYLNSDPDYLVSTIESELTFTNSNWFFPGRPTLTIVLTNAMLGDITNKGPSNHNVSNEGLANALLTADVSKKNLLNFFMNLRSGECNGVRIRLSRLTETVNTSNIESLDFLINKPDVDWSNILSTNKTYLRKDHNSHKRLGFNESNVTSPGGIHTPGGAKTPGGARTPRRKSVFGGKSLGTPLDKLNHDSYFQDIATALEKINTQSAPAFKLKDHEIETPKSETPAPPSVGGNDEVKEKKSADLKINTEDNNQNSEMLLSLTLGDLSQFEPAVKSLQASVNLYDQIDLLQYLASCKNLDEYIVDLDATIRDLLEEVYVKSKRLQYWSVARQASGLLNKTVPSLTYNLTDLVIRQKQVTIGSGSTEHLISTPVGPDTLNKMIAEQCLDDVREGPVVQEIIISLGNFIRTSPYMFDGILRLRTHFIIIALREEISRINHFNEEEAIEHLMQLSPFELQSLLGTVLSGPGMCEDTTIIVRDKPGGYLVLSQEFDPARRSSAELPNLRLPPSKNHVQVEMNDEAGKPKKEVLVIRAQSGGYNAGNFARVEINGNVLSATTRGLHVWAIDRLEKVVLEHASFDTHISTDESEDLVQFIRSLEQGLIVVMASKDDFTEHLSKEAIDVLKSLGASKIENVKYRDSYVLITEKNGDRDQAIEAHKAANEGPTDLIEEEFAILKKNDILPSEITTENISHFCPSSNGRWLRRRKNDGALNRVPRHFFSRTWSILDNCHGFKIGSHFLPRDPTVFEKTSEEFNFALAVEGFLGIFRDPAERQVAVEILSLIYRMQKKNPDCPMIEMNIDLPAIMESAISDFWNTWVNQNKEVFEKSPLFEHGFDYNTHKEMAHGLFYDLPLENSSESTSAYLVKSIKKNLNLNVDFDI